MHIAIITHWVEYEDGMFEETEALYVHLVRTIMTVKVSGHVSWTPTLRRGRVQLDLVRKSLLLVLPRPVDQEGRKTAHRASKILCKKASAWRGRLAWKEE